MQSTTVDYIVTRSPKASGQPRSSAVSPLCCPRPRLIRQPVSGLRAAVWTIAARVFRLWLLDRPDVGPRHACVAPFVCRVILAVSHDIFGPVRIVLQKRTVRMLSVQVEKVTIIGRPSPSPTSRARN
jgi:hypothetical protein